MRIGVKLRPNPGVAAAKAERTRLALASSSSYLLGIQLRDAVLQRATTWIVQAQAQASGEAIRSVRETLGVAHLLWLAAGSYAAASLLMDPEQVEEADRWARHVETGKREGFASAGSAYFTPPGRAALPGVTGVGKSALALGALAVVEERWRGAGGRQGPGATGMLYATASRQLLRDAYNALAAMGVDMQNVGVIYTEEDLDEDDEVDGAASELVLTSPEELSSKVIVLCTQQMIGSLSRKKRLLTTQRTINAEIRRWLDDDSAESSELTLEKLLAFQGAERRCVWDEAFLSMDASVVGCEWIEDLIQKLRRPAFRRIENIQVQEALAQLDAFYIDLGKARSGITRSKKKRGRVIDWSMRCFSGMKTLIELLKQSGEKSEAACLKRLMKMALLDVKVSVAPSPAIDESVFIVQPIPRVDSSLKRVLILDASYRISVLAKSDRTVREVPVMQALATAGLGGEKVAPKSFERVHLRLAKGPAGRVKMEKSAKTRRALIRRQVERITANVPDSEPFLVITFRKKKGIRAVDWKQEIRDELDRQGVPDWRNRLALIHWGQHRGRNSWSHIKYGFAVGVVHRQWGGDLHIRVKTLEGDLVHMDRTRLANAAGEGVVSEVASDLIQLLGRLHSRVTRAEKAMESSLAGVTHFWVEMCEPGTAAAVLADSSPLLQLVDEAMPGIQVTLPSSRAKAAADETEGADGRALIPEGVSAEELISVLVIRWVSGYRGETFTSMNLLAHLREDRPGLMGSVTMKTYQRAIQRAMPEVEQMGWEKATSRTWVRAG